MQFYDTIIVAFAAMCSAALALYWITRSGMVRDVGRHPAVRREDEEISMLFEADRLQHASHGASHLFRLVAGRENWTSVRNKLQTRFPDLPLSPEDVPDGTSTTRTEHLEDAAIVSLERTGNFVRLVLIDKIGQLNEQSNRLREVETELEHLKRASETTPHAIWQVDQEGTMQWCNDAYARLFDRIHPSERDKNTPVFDLPDAISSDDSKQRVSLQSPEQVRKDWYDVTAVTSDNMTVYHALDVNAVVKSEIAQRNFVQTLAKTFAQLSIGLAIFDRNGQLALFNPALIDLTNLPADFLSGRPTLMSFFDRIRENRRMPEPKNYQSWRQQITEVIAAATDGRYEETWTLETGQTFRVNGRPHPDGAIAFLIEDISAEVSLTRNFRAELELGQSLMDTFDEALVVFSSAGVLTFSNQAYRDMWGIDPESSFADITIADSIQEWKRQCKPGATWSELSEFVLDFERRRPWMMPVGRNDGIDLSCSVSRIATGATIIRFSRQPDPVKTDRSPATSAASF